MSDRPLYYDRSGQPIDVQAMSTLIVDPEYMRVALTDLPDGGHVSTVWLGIDHDFSRTGPPLIFESLRFPECEDMDRYSTLREALEGHERMVARALRQPKKTP